MLHHTCHKAPVYGSFVIYAFLFLISKLSKQQINALVLGLSAVYPCSAIVSAFCSSATAMLPVPGTVAATAVNRAAFDL